MTLWILYLNVAVKIGHRGNLSTHPGYTVRIFHSYFPHFSLIWKPLFNWIITIFLTLCLRESSFRGILKDDINAKSSRNLSIVKRKRIRCKHMTHVSRSSSSFLNRGTKKQSFKESQSIEDGVRIVKGIVTLVKDGGHERLTRTNSDQP